jgi:hypothetical protein
MLYYLFCFFLFSQSLSALEIQRQTPNTEDPETINSYRKYLIEGKAVGINNQEKNLFIRNVFNWLDQPYDDPDNLSTNLEKNCLYAKALLYRNAELQIIQIIKDAQDRKVKSQACQLQLDRLFEIANDANNLTQETKRLLNHSYIWWAQLSIEIIKDDYQKAWDYLSKVDNQKYTQVSDLWKAHLILINNYTPINLIDLNAAPHQAQRDRLKEARRLLKLEPVIVHVPELEQQQLEQQQLIGILHEAGQNRVVANNIPNPAHVAQPVVQNTTQVAGRMPKQLLVRPEYLNAQKIKELKIRLQTALVVQENHLNNPDNAVDLGDDYHNDNDVETIVFAHGPQPRANTATANKRFKEQKKSEQKFNESSFIKNIPPKKIEIIVIDDDTPINNTTPCNKQTINLTNNIPEDVKEKYSGYKRNNIETKKDKQETKKNKLNTGIESGYLNSLGSKKNTTDSVIIFDDKQVDDIIDDLRIRLISEDNDNFIDLLKNSIIIINKPLIKLKFLDFLEYAMQFLNKGVLNNNNLMLLINRFHLSNSADKFPGESSYNLMGYAVTCKKIETIKFLSNNYPGIKSNLVFFLPKIIKEGIIEILQFLKDNHEIQFFANTGIGEAINTAFNQQKDVNVKDFSKHFKGLPDTNFGVNYPTLN